jgi:predicted transcriptional regulator
LLDDIGYVNPFVRVSTKMDLFRKLNFGTYYEHKAVKEKEKITMLFFGEAAWSKPRSKFGKWLDSKGVKQQWLVQKTGISRGAISQLAIDDTRVPTYTNAMKIEKALREIDPSVRASRFWDID